MKWREDMKEFCGGGLELAFLSPYLGIPGSVCQAPPSAWTLSDYGKPAHHTVHVEWMRNEIYAKVELCETFQHLPVTPIIKSIPLTLAYISLHDMTLTIHPNSSPTTLSLGLYSGYTGLLASFQTFQMFTTSETFCTMLSPPRMLSPWPCHGLLPQSM